MQSGILLYMTGLIIDTSRDPAILGLVHEGVVEKMTLIEGSKNLSAKVFPALQSFCKLKDLSYIAVGVGPGSYMGIRTGATIAKTLAYASNLPLIEFVSPIAFLPKNLNGPFSFVGDAKMGQLYVMTGIARDGRIYEFSSPQLISPELEISALEPNLNWVAPEVHNRFIQKNFASVAALELTYLR